MKASITRILIIASTMFWGQSAIAQSNTSNLQSSVSGQDIYIRECAVCHGTQGRGDGILATSFSPQPRNFVVGTYRYRSTGYGAPPARADLERVIRNGFEGSYGRSMPAFDTLQPGEVRALTDFIKQLSGIREFGAPTQEPAPPAQKNVALGRQLFQENGCHECHGSAGDGRGILAADMFDEDNNPIRPANLQTGMFKGGSAPEDIFLRVKYGIDGTPMPSFGRNLSSQDLWALTNFVLSLSKPD